MNQRPVFGGKVDELRAQYPTSHSELTQPVPPAGDTHPSDTTPMSLDDLDLRKPQFKSSFMAHSEPHTPIEQTPPPVLGGYDQAHRFGSVSSIATTDDDEASSNEIIYPWNEQQDELVRNIYEDLLASPQLTPFSGRYPPSGVLHRVAKDSLRMAKHRQIYFPHSMNAVRQRVINYFHNEADHHDDLQRYRLPNDYFSMPVSDNPSSDSGEFDFTDAIGSTRRMSVEEKYAQRHQALQPAFREPAQSVLTEEEVVNIVAKRKRDSLRMKRGPH